MSNGFPRTLGDRYQLIAPLGEGGMASVYRALDLRLQRPVAVKMLSTAQSREPEVMRRFTREAQAMAKVVHEHVVQVYGLHEDPGELPYIVSELVEGVDLAGALNRLGPLTWQHALWLVDRVLSGLTELHQNGIIHRDLKPSNILITPEGQPKIADLGIAHVVGHTAITTDGVQPGTLAYMPPEAFANAEATAAFDLWGAGCVLYELIAGVAPFAQATVPALINQIVSARYRPLEEAVPEVEPRVAELVKRLLAAAPRARPAAADVARRDCRAIISAANISGYSSVSRKFFARAMPEPVVSKPGARGSGRVPVPVPAPMPAPVPEPAPAWVPGPVAVPTQSAPVAVPPTAAPERPAIPQTLTLTRVQAALLILVAMAGGFKIGRYTAPQESLPEAAAATPAPARAEAGLVAAPAGSEARPSVAIASPKARSLPTPVGGALSLRGVPALIHGQQYAEALWRVRGVLATEPESGPALALLARIHFERKEIREAEAVARRAHELHPSDGAVLDIYAEIALFNNQPEKALELAQALVVVRPTDPTAYTALAQVLCSVGKFDDAHNAIDTALQLNPEPEVRDYLRKLQGQCSR